MGDKYLKERRWEAELLSYYPKEGCGSFKSGRKLGEYEGLYTVRLKDEGRKLCIHVQNMEQEKEKEDILK